MLNWQRDILFLPLIKRLFLWKGRHKLDKSEIMRAALEAQWLTKLSESSNRVYMPLYFSEKRYLVLMGGGGSGKSIFAGRKLLERLNRERGHRALVLRKVARTLRESCFRQLEEQIKQHFDDGWKINRTEMSITAPNGNQIVFAGLDDAEKLKSIYGITMVWVEEASEISEADFNQIDIRVRGESRYYKQIILSFNPVNINHWLKRRFFDRIDPDAEVLHTTYRDNRFLDEAAITVLENYRDTDKYFYSVYTLGQWGVTGKSIFSGEQITERLAELIPPIMVGDFVYREEGGRLITDGFSTELGGSISIYAEPKKNCAYVIGGDTAGDGSDYFCAQVLGAASGVQAAVLRQKYDEDVYAKELFALGSYYNNALIAVEANYSTYPIRELTRLGYTNQFIRETEDSFTRKKTTSYVIVCRVGRC